MLLDQRERQIRTTLRKLSQQRVAIVLQPQNVWVIENSLQDSEDNDAALKTCYMRGWVEPIQQAVPQRSLQPDGSLLNPSLFTGTTTMYRLTDSGWAVINRTYLLSILTVFLTALTIIVGVAAA